MTRMEKFVVVVSLVCCAILAAAAWAEAATVEELQAQIAALQAQLAATSAPAPQAAVTATPAQPVVVSPAETPAPGVDGATTSDDLSGVIFYDPDEVVEPHRMQVWLNTVEGRRLVEVYMGFGKRARGDNRFLFTCGKRVVTNFDTNGHGDGSCVNGGGFSSEKEIIGGYAIFHGMKVPRCVAKDGRHVPCHFNLCIAAREGAFVSNAKAGFSLREFFDEYNSSFEAMSPSDWFDRELDFARDKNDSANKWMLKYGGGDPAYFALYVAAPGEHINLEELHEKLVKEGKYVSRSHWLHGTPQIVRDDPKPVAKKAAGKKVVRKRR